MANDFWGKLSAEPIEESAVVQLQPAGGAPGGATDVVSPPKAGDKSLPDSSAYAAGISAVLMGVAVAVGVALNAAELTTAPFDPATNTTANFALFAGFYVAAQVIERVMEFVAPILPPGNPTEWLKRSHPQTPGDPFWQDNAAGKAARAAQIKADRAKLALGAAAVLGVLASCLFGLFFLRAVGMQVSPTVDTILTGITIAAGTKALHDFISILQNKDNPTTNRAPS